MINLIEFLQQNRGEDFNIIEIQPNKKMLFLNNVDIINNQDDILIKEQGGISNGNLNYIVNKKNIKSCIDNICNFKVIYNDNKEVILEPFI